MNVTITTDNDVTKMAIEGRVDTTNVHLFEKEVTPLLEKPTSEIVVDCSDLDYISSSGLRVFLTMQKKIGAAGSQLVLREMKPDIKEIFDMTGFTSVFNIE